FDLSGSSAEENKMNLETRKILGLKDLKVSATCVRVPVERCHGVSVAAEFEKPVSVAEARELIARFPGVILCDNPRKGVYPNSVVAGGRDEVYVGRIREDRSKENGILFYCVADNIRKGAATNAVQIAETVVGSPFFTPASRC
ncbi:MAG: aspartate-semialdehyde dehydrogenase, partial [Clostridia bacterium]|nr:aspartate-semialdehyde dehydrogenase [Clostridia bacterium]